jgi:peptidoglycan/xylan/chitin deacetylase (PgdA/CDA1 family)
MKIFKKIFIFSLMKPFSKIIFFYLFLISSLGCNKKPGSASQFIVDEHGAIVRMDTTKKMIYLVFTAHEFADGFSVIHETLAKHDIKASFFFTGDFYRAPEFSKIIETLKKEGHYLGAHSDKHLLYCTWENRDSLLVTETVFNKDVLDNYSEMEKFGIKKEDALYFMPPYEWYNLEISNWTKQLGLTLFNFSDGTSSNQDWTYPELGKAYISSDTIFNRIIHFEKNHGMNGFIFLSHIGTDPRRTDKFYNKLDQLIEYLKGKGYSFSRIE